MLHILHTKYMIEIDFLKLEIYSYIFYKYISHIYTEIYLYTQVTRYIYTHPYIYIYASYFTYQIYDQDRFPRITDIQRKIILVYTRWRHIYTYLLPILHTKYMICTFLLELEIFKERFRRVHAADIYVIYIFASYITYQICDLHMFC